MALAKDLRYTISGDARDFTRTLRGVDKKLADSDSKAKRFGKGLAYTFGGLGTAATAAGAAIAGGLVVEAKRSFDAFQESNKITKQTRAVLKSTGGAANVTAKQVGNLASAISKKTGVDDEAIQSGENLLLTFTNVRNEAGKGNDIFSRATKTITDMSVALGQDTKSSAIQLGKALNDPIKGITALQRVGVSFTQQQKDQIKALVESGDTLGAQKVILGELNKEFGGSAVAQATATDKMKVAIGNVEEAIGKGLAPAVDAVSRRITRFARAAEPALSKVADKIGKIFGRGDLDLGEKLKISAGVIRKKLEPFVSEGRDALDRMHLGAKFQKLVEEAAPRIADALAASAPRAAGAFVRAFKEAGPWGKLLTVAFLAQKIGAFGAVGSLAADRFTSRFRKSTVPAMTVAGTAAGAANAAAFTTASSAGIVKGKGKFRGAALALGRYMGPLVAIPLAVELADALSKEFGHGGTDKVFGDLKDKIKQDIRDRNAGAPAIKAPNKGVPRGVTSSLVRRPVAGAATVRENFHDPAGIPSPGRDHYDHVHVAADGPGELEYLMGVARKFGLSIGSTTRTPEQNAAVGGSPTSYHLRGMAFDASGSPQAMIAFAKWVQRYASGATSGGRPLTVNATRKAKPKPKPKPRLQSTVTGMTGGLGKPKKKPRLPPAKNFLPAQLALAELTPGVDDDLAVLGLMEARAVKRLANAMKSGDPKKIAAAAGGLKDVRDMIGGLKTADTGDGTDPNQPLIDALAEAAEVARLQTEALTSLAGEQKRGNDLTEQISRVESSVLKQALADAVSGSIGGRVLRGLGTPAFAGSSMAY